MKYRIAQQPPPASGAHNDSPLPPWGRDWGWGSPAHPAAEPSANLKTRPHRPLIRRYLPAFENLGIDKGGALWSYVHDTAPVFNRVRAAALPRLKDQWLQRQIMKTAGV